MRRVLIALLALLLGACASYHHGGGYYGRTSGHGDYYHGVGPIIGYSGPGWYGPYDAMFWSLRYSYFDPFWYPNFHYGITYFPRYYYGWPFWSAGSYWRWRGHHPYSPHYGSWWDHYYHWQRPAGPRRRLDADVRGAGGSGPVRYGSARNAAERMAQGRTGGDGWPTALARDPATGAGLRQRSGPFEPGALPSSRYAPRRGTDRVDGFQRNRGSDGIGSGPDHRQRSRGGDGIGRGLDHRQRSPALERRSSTSGAVEGMRFQPPQPQGRGRAPAGPAAGPWVEPSRPVTFRAPARAPAPRTIAPAPAARRADPPAAPARSAVDRGASPSFDRGASRGRGEH